MVRIQLKYSVVVRYWLINPSLLLVGAPSNVVCSCIIWAKLHQVVAIGYSLIKHSFFEIRRASDKESFLVARIFIEFFCANCDQIVDVKSLPINCRSVPQSRLRLKHFTLRTFTGSIRGLNEVCLSIFLWGLVKRWLTGAQSLTPLWLKSFLLILVATLHLLLHLVYHLFLLQPWIFLWIIIHRRVWFNIDIQWIGVLRDVSSNISVSLLLLATGVLCPFVIELFSVAARPDLLRLAAILRPLRHLILPLWVVRVCLSRLWSVAFVCRRALEHITLTMHRIGQGRVRPLVRMTWSVQLLLWLINLLHVVMLALLLELVCVQMHRLLLQRVVSLVHLLALGLVVVEILLGRHLLLRIHHFFFKF